MGWPLLLSVPFGTVAFVAHPGPSWLGNGMGVASLLGFATALVARYRWQRVSNDVRQRMETLSRCTPDLLLETDPEGVITFANERAINVLGYDATALVGQSIRDLAEGPVPILDEPLAANDTMITWNTRWHHANGTDTHLTTFLTSMGSPEHPRGLRGVVRDQQDRVETERALLALAERFRAALNTARNGIMLVADDGRVLLSNEALRKLLGRTELEMSALTVADVVPGRYVDQFAALMASRMWSDAVPSQYELQLQAANGTPLDVEITLSPVREDGRDTGTLIEVHDLTESRRTSETIRRMADYDRLTGLPNRDLFDCHV